MTSDPRNVQHSSYFIFLMILASLIASVRAQEGSARAQELCIEGNNDIADNTTYLANRDLLLYDLRIGVDSGFYNTSEGQNSSIVYGAVLCRGDIQLDTCRSCVQNGSIVLQRMCQYNRQAVFWNTYCTLRYSDQPTFRSLDTNHHYYNSFQMGSNVTSPNEFRADLMSFLDELGGRASNGGDSMKVAAGNINTSDSQIIYALVQCTPDLDPTSCTTCLNDASVQLPITQSAMSFTPSCNIQYSIRPFLNQTWVSELEQLPPQGSPAITPQGSPAITPQDSQPGNQSAGPVGVPRSNTTRVIIIVIFSVAAVLLVIGLFVGFFIRRRNNQKPSGETTTNNEVVDDINRAKAMKSSNHELIGIVSQHSGTRTDPIVQNDEVVDDINRAKAMKSSNHELIGIVSQHSGTRTDPIVQNGVAHAHPSTMVASSMDNGTVASFKIDFDELKAATDDFSESNELGRGGFGIVYKGKLDGRDIAVKRWSVCGKQDAVQFNAEIDILAKLEHPNLVNLIGFSSKRQDKLLVYEYVPNGSLDKFLFDATKRLDWDTRYKIIEGIVKGIVYLQQESGHNIIHRDLKPANVLLDGNMDAKIADFGLARLLDIDDTHVSTCNHFGTPSYNAPEYEDKGQFSFASDVFSFGVLLLEIISGQMYKRIRGTKHNPIMSRAWDNWCKGDCASLVDPSLLMGNSTVPGKILNCIQIGLLCVQHNKEDRPSIASVFTMLNSLTSYSFRRPSQPGFYVGTENTIEEKETPNNLAREGERTEEPIFHSLKPIEEKENPNKSAKSGDCVSASEVSLIDL